MIQSENHQSINEASRVITQDQNSNVSSSNMKYPNFQRDGKQNKIYGNIFFPLKYNPPVQILESVDIILKNKLPKIDIHLQNSQQIVPETKNLKQQSKTDTLNQLINDQLLLKHQNQTVLQTNGDQSTNKESTVIKSNNNNISQSIFQNDIRKENTTSFYNKESQKTSHLFMAPLTTTTYIYTVQNGNNQEVVRRVLKKRPWLNEAISPQQACNFRWKPTSIGINFDELNQNARIMMFRKMNIDQVTPKTIIFNISSDVFEQELRQFVDLFISTAESQQFKNIWLLKPSDLNRGRGIQLFSSLRALYYMLIEYGKEQTLKSYLQQINKSQYLKRIDEKIEQQIKSNMAQQKNQYGSNNKQGMQFTKKYEKQIVLQKYIESPLLIEKRKFDIRLWVLIDQDMKFYTFREPYLRLSSEKFSLQRKDLHNKFIHLTNNAIQKNGSNYNKYEEGNIWSLNQFQINTEKIMNQARELVKISLLSVRRKLTFKERKYCFELFGYDFMVDSNGQVYLIEINTNPCIEEPCYLLAQMVPRMLNDCFRLTVDKIFGSNSYNNDVLLNKYLQKKYHLKDSFGLYDFTIDGFNNYENLWDLQGSLQ